MTPDEWQFAADVAQFYLSAQVTGIASMLDGMVDTGRCEQVLTDANELGIRPRGRDALMRDLMKMDRFPSFPGESGPPLV